MKRGKQNHSKWQAALNVNEALSLKEDLKCQRVLSREQLLHVLQADKSCDSACKGKKDNPNCLCGLVPAVGSVRRKGLWQKEPQGLQHLGANPADQKRQDAALPCGLNNLGNTCYVNSALQCLFMTPVFRNAMYQIAPPAADDVIVGHIRRLFVELQSGPRFSADPKAFAQALNLDHTIQQDSQEFWKLLLSKLEEKLGSSQQPAVQSLVPELFRGSYAYQTICKACGKASQGSNRGTHFYELDIQVKGSSSLENSLTDMLCKEELAGDNQYFCEFCGKKADATRQLCLQQLPPYLCLSLQRFVFDMKKMMKVKASDKFSFPLSLDFAPYQSPSAAPHDAGSQQYDLQAILIHKGPSASQGHYVAHVYDEATQKWWRFDDETVTVMPSGPIGEKADNGVAAAPLPSSKKSGEKGKSKTKGKGRKRKAPQDHQEDESSPEPMQATAADDAGPSSNGATHSHTPPVPSTSSSDITSSHAYMLLYKRRGWQAPPHHQTGPAALPDSLQEYVDEENKKFEVQCTNFETTQQQVRQTVRSHQAAVRNILDLAPVPDDQTDCRFVASDWLAKWADSDPPITNVDNSALQCPHGKLLPHKPLEMKRISILAWEHLRGLCTGGPEFGPDDVCTVCLADLLDAVTSADKQGQAQETALAMAEGLDEQDVAEASQTHGHYVSKTWLTGWKKRQGRSMSSTSPTEGISCPHGGLLPAALGPRAKSIAVPAPLWDYFKDSWQRAQQLQQQQSQQQQQQHQSQQQAAVKALAVADDVDEAADQQDVVMLDEAHSNHQEPAQAVPSEEATVLREFPVQSTFDCQECLANLDVSAANGQVLASEAEQERMQAPQLAAATQLYLEPGVSYSLMPRAWLQQWRAYINGASRRGKPQGAVLPAPPSSLKEAYQALLCSCHSGDDSRLAHPLPGLIHRRGKWMQADMDNGVFEVVATTDWCQLVGRHVAAEADQIRLMEVTLDVQTLAMDGDTLCLEGAKPDERVISDNVLQDVQRAQPATARQAASLQSSLPVCEDTIERQEAEAKAAQLVYKDAEIMVEVIAQADFKPDTLNLTGDRKSKRARKGRAPIKVNADDSIHALKLKVVQTLNVHPQNALLHLFRAGRWQPVTGTDATLADHSILPDEEVIVVNTHEHDDDDLGSFFGASSTARTEPERGFTGTALSGHVSTVVN